VEGKKELNPKGASLKQGFQPNYCVSPNRGSFEASAFRLLLSRLPFN